ncbi:MAG TPA: cysteine hydrolase [Candidatus Ornithomonoglobus intestinigallinarum]|uniref:Cysteine hydrolase n=1 Tax=Candidatus Ornithomonoglobus intestinigallinarum TaxID=2840894 RepID=A0A9D1KRG8_9FIRM|nr:cysteine hydrolase [Candidatus Ornithomonoglobus intestinigallinarum]
MKRLLVVVDYQNDFVDGALGFDGAELLDEKIAARVREYGRGNVIFTRDTHFDDYLNTREGKLLPVPHCIKGTHGHDIYGKTKAALEEIGAHGFDKTSFGLKIDDSVRKYLPGDVDEIELAGLVSNICVLSNAVVFQTEYPQARITVDASLTGGADRELTEKALDVLEGIQVRVSNRR